METTVLTASYINERQFVLPPGVKLLPVDVMDTITSIRGVEGAWYIKHEVLQYFWEGKLWKMEPTYESEHDMKYPDRIELDTTEEDK